MGGAPFDPRTVLTYSQSQRLKMALPGASLRWSRVDMAFHTGINTAVAWRLAVAAQFSQSTLLARRAGVLAGPFPRTPPRLMVGVCCHGVRHSLHPTPCCDFGRRRGEGSGIGHLTTNGPGARRHRERSLVPLISDLSRREDRKASNMLTRKPNKAWADEARKGKFAEKSLGKGRLSFLRGIHTFFAPAAPLGRRSVAG